jgi:hypothetical protein
MGSESESYPNVLKIVVIIASTGIGQGRRRKLDNELHNMYSSPNIIGVIKS